MRKSHHSLHGLLRRSLLRSVVCMILPVCVLAGLLVVLTQRYGADIALTTRASEVRTVLVQDLPDEVWNVVSGRISFEDGRQRMLIDSALWELNDMLDSAGEDEAQYLNAALRAIRTIDSYVDQLETQMDDMKQLISQQSAADRQCVSFLKQETMKNLIAGRYAHDPRRYAEALTALSCPSPTEPVNLFCILSPKNPDFKAAYGQLICLSERYLSNAAGFTCFVMEQDRFWGVLQLNEDLEINALQDMLSSVVEHYSRLSNQVAVCLLSHSAKNAEEFCAHCARIKGYNGEIADSPYVHIITPKTAPLTSKAILTSVMEYIDRNLSGDVSLETLAKAAGYNPSYLSRLFLQHMGINLSNYIARQKMKAIVRLLNCPEYSLDQIMEIAGFENKSTFNRFVKRMTGYSPKRYRENLTDIEKAAPGQAASLTGVSFPSDDEPEKQ